MEEFQTFSKFKHENFLMKSFLLKKGILALNIYPEFLNIYILRLQNHDKIYIKLTNANAFPVSLDKSSKSATIISYTEKFSIII